MVNTKGLDQAAVLVALFNNARPKAIGHLNFGSSLSIEKAKEILESNGTYFDYLGGRSVKVDLNDPDEFEEFLYDRDNGNGSAQRAINSIKR